MKIALIGRSGAGKTTLADHLQNEYGFFVCRTGVRCRQLAREFFDTEDKSTLQAISDGMRRIDSLVWLRAALREVPHGTENIVVDSIRTVEEHDNIRALGYVVWRVTSSQALRFERLMSRGQTYSLEKDEGHATEMSLDNVMVDLEFENNRQSLTAIHEAIREALGAQ